MMKPIRAEQIEIIDPEGGSHKVKSKKPTIKGYIWITLKLIMLSPLLFLYSFFFILANNPFKRVAWSRWWSMLMFSIKSDPEERKKRLEQLKATRKAVIDARK